jgi:hypothetical protein
MTDNDLDMSITFLDDLSKYSYTDLRNARVDMHLSAEGFIIPYDDYSKASGDIADRLINTHKLDAGIPDFNGKSWMAVREVTRSDVVGHIDRVRAKNSGS